MKSHSKDFNHLSGWTLDNQTLKEFDDLHRVSPDLPLRPCGCGVKIDLDHIVYPTLRIINEREVQERRDCFQVNRKILNVKRFVFNEMNWSLVELELEKYFSEKKPEVLIELYSSSFNLYKAFDQLKSQFEHDQKHFFDLLNRLQQKFPSLNLTIGKGHSIQGSAHFLCLDFVELGEEQNSTTLLNNDTIVTGDSVLEPHSPVSVFIAFNNALNDLLIYGGFNNIKIYPVYDGTPEQVDAFHYAFNMYLQFMGERHVDVEIIDQGPLNIGAHLIGATVSAESKKKNPGYKSVKSNQKILITHNLGDLGLLSVHRSQFLKKSIDPKIAAERMKVLEKLTSPHILMSKIVSNYLEHISFISDVSGPGLSVLSEVSEASKINLQLDEMRFDNVEILNHPRKNYTTSTNGPWLIIADEVIIESIKVELHKAGFTEAHLVGFTQDISTSPKIKLSPTLLDRYQKPMFKYDVFSPEITVQTEHGPQILKCPLFP